jgi:hypothetical protein
LQVQAKFFAWDLLWKAARWEKLYIQKLSFMYPSHSSNVWKS